MNKYNSKGINYQSEKDDWKKFKENSSIIQRLPLMCYMKKKWKYALPTFQNAIQIMKKQIILLIISN